MPGLEKTERDLLIELSTKVELLHQEQSRIMMDHTKDDARQFGEVTNKVDSAHKRMDKIGITLEGFKTLKDKVLGAVAFAGFAGSFIMALIMIFKPH